MATPNCITIPLTRGYSTVIDRIDSDLANFNWTVRVDLYTSYAQRHKTINRVKQIIHLHRVILGRILGRELLPDERVDHEDGDGLNNRRKNLRFATHGQNMQNKRLYKSNSIGLKGVRKSGSKYQARITVDGKLIHLGTHATPELAAAAYNSAALEYFGEFARLNKGE